MVIKLVGAGGQVLLNTRTVLVDEHTNGDAAHVEPVKEVLHVLTCDGVLPKRLFVLNHPLCHGGHHVIVSVPDLNQGLCETGGQ